jgi:hypothetical protein
VKIGVGREQAEFSENIYQAAKANILEKIFRGLRTALSGLVNFGSR